LVAEDRKDTYIKVTSFGHGETKNQNWLGPKIIGGEFDDLEVKRFLVDPKLMTPKWKSQSWILIFGQHDFGRVSK
jgi:hypothetical protein